MALPDLKKQLIERDQDYLFYKKGYYELKEEKEKNEDYFKNKLKVYEENFTKLEKDNETIINLLNKLNEIGNNNSELNKNLIDNLNNLNTNIKTAATDNSEISSKIDQNYEKISDSINSLEKENKAEKNKTRELISELNNNIRNLIIDVNNEQISNINQISSELEDKFQVLNNNNKKIEYSVNTQQQINKENSSQIEKIINLQKTFGSNLFSLTENMEKKLDINNTGLENITKTQQQIYKKNNIQTIELQNKIVSISKKQNKNTTQLENITTNQKSIENNIFSLTKNMKKQLDANNTELKNITKTQQQINKENTTQTKELQKITKTQQQINKENTTQTKELQKITKTQQQINKENTTQTKELQKITENQTKELAELQKIKKDLKVSNDNLDENIKETYHFLEKSFKRIEKDFNSENYKKMEKTMNEIKYSLIFKDTIKNSEWLTNNKFSLNNSSSNYSYMYLLYRVLDETHSKNILEFGLGQTTKMINQFSEYYSSKVKVIEDNEEWIKHFSKFLDDNKNMEILKTELEEFDSENSTNIRYNLKLKKREKFDLILVDGPFGGRLGEEKIPQEYPRSNIWNLVDNLKDEFIIIFDDYDRPGERNTASELMKKLDSNNISYMKKMYKALKYQLIICSENYNFLTWL